MSRPTPIPFSGGHENNGHEHDHEVENRFNRIDFLLLDLQGDIRRLEKRSQVFETRILEKLDAILELSRVNDHE